MIHTAQGWNSQNAEFDQQHIWHPYSTFHNPPPVFPVVAANGVRIRLADGRELIDGMASWWSAIHGYNHPELNQAATAQLEQMSHVMFGGLTHPAAVKLCSQLIELTPDSLSKVFLSDSGSVAVEVALKMALQYWVSAGHPEKTRFIALKNGYHGDTFGAMSVCDPITGMHHLFSQILPQHLFAPSPSAGFNESPLQHELNEIEQLIKNHHAEVAAFILEPVVQGAGGMKIYSPAYLEHIRALCDRYNILLIFDEIATGFGRTGKLFATHHSKATPDILCLGKALTGGYLSMAATLCSDQISDGICQGEAGAFMHGPTFMGNPLACAIATRSIELLLAQDWEGNIRRLEQGLRQGLTPASVLPGVKEVRCLGAIGVIELEQPLDLRIHQQCFVDNGVWIRPFGKLVYTMPPYIMSDEDLASLCQAMVKTVAQIQGAI